MVSPGSVSMIPDSNVLAVFKARAGIAGGSYQTLMNEALKQFAHGLNLSDIVAMQSARHWINT